MTLTKAQRRFLTSCAWLEDERGLAGIIPNAGQHRMLRRLAEKGLLCFHSVGRHEDREGDFRIFALTELGRCVLDGEDVDETPRSAIMSEER